MLLELPEFILLAGKREGREKCGTNYEREEGADGIRRGKGEKTEVRERKEGDKREEGKVGTEEKKKIWCTYHTTFPILLYFGNTGVTHQNKKSPLWGPANERWDRF
uniref:Uncharacterized protein n=1 Tax=Cacopsylla melanoneura TaxID=428564 RepID=A0A8D8ZCI4_9HEMI